MTMMIDLPAFDAGECGALSERLEASRPDWIRRGEGFSTLGVATYLDVMATPGSENENYYGRLGQWNEIIRELFGVELERVRSVLAAHFGEPVRFDAGVALPGFHIFEDLGICTAEWPSQHFDLQHRMLQWPFPLASDDVISFTMPIRLPRLGGALEVWEFLEEDMIRMERMGRRPSMEQVGRLKPSRRHEYYLGTLAVQLRPLMHRIAAIRERFPGDQRMTLQGHGVRDQAGWVLYW